MIMEIMGMNTKEIQIINLEIALDDLDKIIDNMKKNDYNKTELNEYVKKRWDVWNQIHKAKNT
jgi:DNA-binding transcriptional regulator YhcF (GntR family)